MIERIQIQPTESVEFTMSGAARLAEKVGEVLFGESSSGGTRRILRVEVATEGSSPLFWLSSQGEDAGFPRLYWSGRDDARSRGGESAAMGTADFAASVAEVEARLKGAVGGASGVVRYYGGLMFDAESDRDERWESFGGGGFVLPRFEMTRSESGGHLACNLVLPDDAGRADEILTGLRALVPQREEGGHSAIPELLTRSDSPDYDGWCRNVERVVSEFEREPGKVVFARRVDLGFGEDLDALRLFASLREKTPGCFHFYFSPNGESAFIGATPERLYGREGLAVRSEAVAGTRPRSGSGDDDAGLREELLGSEKDLAEQRYVRDSIEEDLRSICAALTVEEGVSEMKLASRRHLISRFRGTLSEDVPDARIVEKLHPTPAVGGYPKEEAAREIRQSEPFDRGMYAGPVGWISPDAAEFAVAIRSGLVRGRELSLFSGAGIVAGSTPDGEWAEIEQKISDFMDVLTADDDIPADSLLSRAVLDRAG